MAKIPPLILEIEAMREFSVDIKQEGFNRMLRRGGVDLPRDAKIIGVTLVEDSVRF